MFKFPCEFFSKLPPAVSFPLRRLCSPFRYSCAPGSTAYALSCFLLGFDTQGCELHDARHLASIDTLPETNISHPSHHVWVDYYFSFSPWVGYVSYVPRRVGNGSPNLGVKRKHHDLLPKHASEMAPIPLFKTLPAHFLLHFRGTSFHVQASWVVAIPKSSLSSLKQT